MMKDLTLGATLLGDGRCRFRLWAPRAHRVAVHVVSPRDQRVLLEKGACGYHDGLVEDMAPGSLYYYRLDDGMERPDPASRYQPRGVHGPSQVCDGDFSWNDHHWFGLPLRDYILYELHVGTFTHEGTFEAVIPHLDDLKSLGVTAIELMPVHQFPGTRNWGYDGVYPFAVQNSYGGPEGLKRLVNTCHQKDLAVVLDVVYNHLGPEGNYLGDFGPYFTEKYRTPWGSPINFDGPHSDEVRRFFTENAICWLREYHVDALRLDAVHAILDFSAQPFLETLATAVREEGERLNRRKYLIPESALNDTRLIRSKDMGGFGLDAQWNDDFHHALHTLLTGEKSGYYKDFGRLHHLSKAFREGYVYSGEYSSYRHRSHGNSSRCIPADRFVVFAQNHDQVGNRMKGERLGALTTFEGLKLAAGCVLLSPFIPLLFMGEEYAETAPFQYFISHTDPDLVAAVRKGRREEFAAFHGKEEPPDPQDTATFERCKLNLSLRREGHHRVMLEFYQHLIRLRKEVRALSCLSKETMDIKGFEKEHVIYMKRRRDVDEAIILFHFGKEPVSLRLPKPEGLWQKRLNSADARWNGPGDPSPAEAESQGEWSLFLSPQSFVLFSNERNP